MTVQCSELPSTETKQGSSRNRYNWLRQQWRTLARNPPSFTRKTFLSNTVDGISQSTVPAIMVTELGRNLETPIAIVYQAPSLNERLGFPPISGSLHDFVGKSFLSIPRKGEADPHQISAYMAGIDWQAIKDQVKLPFILSPMQDQNTFPSWQPPHTYNWHSRFQNLSQPATTQMF